MAKRRKMRIKDKKFLRRICLEYLERFCLHPKLLPEDRRELITLPLERFNYVHREDVALVQRLGKKYLFCLKV